MRNVRIKFVQKTAIDAVLVICPFTDQALLGN